MAVIYANSFEAGVSLFYLNEGWSFTYAGPVSTPSGLHKDLNGNGGSYCLELTYSVSYAVSPTISTLSRWLHTWWNPTTPGSSGYKYVFYRNGEVTFRVDMLANGGINLYRGDGAVLVASAMSGTINMNVSHWIACYCLAASAGGLVELWIDGAPMLTFSGNTKGATLADWDQFNVQAISTGGCWVDDIIVTDATTGRLDEHYCAPLRPDGNISTMLTPSVGTNYQTVDEAPVSTTDYNSAAATGDTDLYSLSGLLFGTSAIACVTVWAWAARQSTITVGEVRVKSGGTNLYAPAVALPASPSYGVLKYIMSTDPDTGAGWTSGGVNGLQAGFRFN